MSQVPSQPAPPGPPEPPSAGPSQGRPAPKPQSRGKSVGGLACGIAGVACACCAPAGLILGVLAVVLSLMARSEARRLGEPTRAATVGLVLGIIAIVLTILLLPLVGVLTFYRDPLADWVERKWGETVEPQPVEPPAEIPSEQGGLGWSLRCPVPVSSGRVPVFRFGEWCVGN